MRISIASVFLLLAAPVTGCVAAVQPIDQSTNQILSERSGPEVPPPPPLELHTAEVISRQTYGYERRVESVAGRKPPETERSDSEGVITAVAYREITDKISLVVDLYDNSDLNLLIREHMMRSLSDAQHIIGEYPLFELSLSSHFHSPVYFSKGPDLGRASFGLDMLPSKLEMNVWSSTHDSLIVGRRYRSYKMGQYDFEIHASLRERSLDDVVWEGRVIAYIERDKAADAAPGMVDALVAKLGQSVHDETFRLK
jgi:hypothetical protein